MIYIILAFLILAILVISALARVAVTSEELELYKKSASPAETGKDTYTNIYSHSVNAKSENVKGGNDER